MTKQHQRWKKHTLSLPLNAVLSPVQSVWRILLKTLKGKQWQEGGPLPGPESGLLSNIQKRIVRGDTHADKARDFIGKGHPGREQQGQGTQESCSAPWLTVSGFMVIGLVPGLSLASHSDPGSFPLAHSSLSQDEFHEKGF